MADHCGPMMAVVDSVLCVVVRWIVNAVVVTLLQKKAQLRNSTTIKERGSIFATIRGPFFIVFRYRIVIVYNYSLSRFIYSNLNL